MRVRVLLVVVALASCHSASPTTDSAWIPSSAKDLGAIVARVGEVPIFAEQVRAQAQAAGRTPRQALAEMIDLYLLAERARKDGIHVSPASDPDVKRALVQRLLEVELEPNLRPETIPDSALRPLYQRGRDAFVHGRLVEIAVLAIYTGSLMKEQPRQERARAASDLAAYLKEHPPKTIEEFQGIARQREWSSRKVVFRRFFQGEGRPLSNKVWAEVQKLRSAGETTPLVEDEDGFFISRYIRERLPRNVTFEEARADIAAGYFERWRQQQFLDFATKLAQLHHVETYFDRLSQDQQRP